MKSFRNDPDSDENREATRQNEREAFAVRMHALRDTECPRCHQLGDECDCEEFMNGL